LENSINGLGSGSKSINNVNNNLKADMQASQSMYNDSGDQSDELVFDDLRRKK